MSTLHISDTLAETIRREARARGLDVEDFLKTIVQRERTFANRAKIEQEQQWWLSQSLAERARYQGEYVAVHDQKLVDHDKDENALYRRVRTQYGRAAVLIIPAEGPREIRILSPRMVRQ